MAEQKDAQNITPTFQRKTPEGKWESVDANGKPLATEDKRTVPQLTEALKGKSVEIPEGVKRDDLVKLAAENGV